MSEKHATDHGFTLIELMIVVILIAIGAALAAPSFANLIRETRLTSEANSLLASLHLARSEAVNRGVQVTVRKNGDINQNWDAGWQVFTDWNANGQIDGNNTDCSISQDCVLRSEGDLHAGHTLRTGNTFGTWLAFLPSGLSVGSGGLANDTFRLCDKTANAALGRSIVVNNTGRPVVEQGVNSCP